MDCSAAYILEETAMAKAKKRVATRKKTSKRGKASAQVFAQEGRKARNAEKAATEDFSKKSSKESGKTEGGAGH